MKNIYFILSGLFFLTPFFLNAQNEVSNNTDILEEAFLKFNTADSTQRNQLLVALNSEINLHPQSKNAPLLLSKLIFLFQSMNKSPQALFNAFKLIIIYGESPQVADAASLADSILSQNLTKKFQPGKPELISLVLGRPAQTNFQQAYLDFISFLHAVAIPALDPMALNEINLYQRHFAGAPNADLDAVFSWRADICLRQHKFVCTWIALEQLTTRYPNSSFTASGYLRLAHLVLEKFHNPLGAKQILLDLINQLPESPSTAEAQYLLAQIFDDYLKLPKEALDNYLVLIKAFPSCPFRADALLRAGELYSKVKAYDDALALYMQVVEDYDLAPQVSVALQRIIYLDRHVFKNPERESHNLLLLAELYPQRSNRPRLLLQAGKLLIGLDKTSEGNKVLRQIIKKYPRSKEAGKAKMLLKN